MSGEFTTLHTSNASKGSNRPLVLQLVAHCDAVKPKGPNADYNHVFAFLLASGAENKAAYGV